MNKVKKVRTLSVLNFGRDYFLSILNFGSDYFSSVLNFGRIFFHPDYFSPGLYFGHPASEK